MNDQFIGHGVSRPTMIVSGRHDLNVEFQQAKDLAANWCANGGGLLPRRRAAEDRFLQSTSPRRSAARPSASASSSPCSTTHPSSACTVSPIPGGSGEIPIPGFS